MACDCFYDLLTLQVTKKRSTFSSAFFFSLFHKNQQKSVTHFVSIFFLSLFIIFKKSAKKRYTFSSAIFVLLCHKNQQKKTEPLLYKELEGNSIIILYQK